MRIFKALISKITKKNPNFIFGIDYIFTGIIQ